MEIDAVSHSGRQQEYVTELPGHVARRGRSKRKAADAGAHGELACIGLTGPGHCHAYCILATSSMLQGRMLRRTWASNVVARASTGASQALLSLSNRLADCSRQHLHSAAGL